VRNENATRAAGMDGTTSGAQLMLYSNSVERVRIDNNGKVGIGTTAPAYKLDVVSSDHKTIKAESTGNDRAEVSIKKSGGTARSWSLAVAGSSNGYSVADKNFYIADTDGGAARLVIDNVGKVGIGTTSPGEILTLDSSSNTRLLLREGGSNMGRIAAGGGGLYIQNLAGDVIFRNISDADTVRIKNDGNVGIGTTSPDAKLDVNGTLRVGNDTRGHYLGEKAVTLNGTTYTTALTIVLSDHNAAHVKLFLTGDWSSHSAVAYVGEYFIQNGAGGYNEPGMIISEFDNTATDFIESKIVDPSTDTFTIQLKLSDSDDGTMTGQICYHVMGEVTSVT